MAVNKDDKVCGGTYHEAQAGPIVQEVTVREDGVRFRQVPVHERHDVVQLPLVLVLDQPHPRSRHRCRRCRSRRRYRLLRRPFLGGSNPIVDVVALCWSIVSLSAKKAAAVERRYTRPATRRLVGVLYYCWNPRGLMLNLTLD